MTKPKKIDRAEAVADTIRDAADRADPETSDGDLRVMAERIDMEVSDDVEDVLAVEGEEFPETETPVTTPRQPPASPLDRSIIEPDFDEAPTAHALDSAPVNSKIVVVRSDGRVKAVLAGPGGVATLPPDDPAAKLPEGAFIQKLGEGWFVAMQLSPALDYPPLKTATAGEAITQFVPHFHRVT